jgi:hypothetical protein
MPVLGIFVKAVLIVAGIWWCKEIFCRLRADIEELRTTGDTSKKGVTIFLWSVTAIIILLIGYFFWSLARSILRIL